MAFNWQTFKTRTLTAIVFGAVMLVGLLWNHWSFFILFSIIHFGCWWEYLKLLEKIHQVKLSFYIKFGLMLMGFAFLPQIGWIYQKIPIWNSADLIVSCIAALGFLLFIIGLIETKNLSVTDRQSYWRGLLGLFYISLPCGLMISLYAYSVSPFQDYRTTDIFLHDTKYVAWSFFYPLLIIATLWINDTMAYIMGSIIGKTQMSKISPKKTWEGTISGIILSAAIIFLLSKFVLKLGDLSYILIVIAIIASITGTFGDLFESKLKRMAGVKDSGHIMPGHGGFLDRFDSLLFAIPFVWLYVYFFMR